MVGALQLGCVVSVLMPSLRLACDELTAIIRCLNSHFRAVSVWRPYVIVRYRTVFGCRRVAVTSTSLINSELYKKIKNCKPVDK